MELKITLLSGESHLLPVPPGTTVASLKTLIFQTFKISPESQKLLYERNGEKITLDNASNSLSAYGLPPDANIFVLITEPVNMQVFLKTLAGETHTYTVPLRETVAEFKLKVKQREKMAVEQQILMHESKNLDVGSRTLESFNVRDGSTIYMQGRLRGG